MDMRKVQKQIGKYELGVHNLFLIRNKNEVRVIAEMARILQELGDYDPQDLDLEDIYALALNKLPARYVQNGSIVLGEPVRESDVADAVRYAISVVRDNPSYSKR
jgi:hypothetical protein